MSDADSKKALLLAAMIPWMVVAGCKASPITIAQSQIEAVFAAGGTFRLFMDSTSQPVNVGGTGGPHIYDFRNLSFFPYDSVTMFSVTRIPQLATRFPSNAFTSNEEANTVFPVFSFSDHSFNREGRARLVSARTEWYQHIIPADEWLRFPVTFNTQYDTHTLTVDTTYVDGVRTEASSDTSSDTKYIDGYGTLLLPGGLAFKCLRLRVVASPPGTSKQFHFWTREGAVVLIGSDNSQPDTGVVQREYVIYFSPQPRTPITRD
jgi:hypothetical protein